MQQIIQWLCMTWFKYNKIELIQLKNSISLFIFNTIYTSLTENSSITEICYTVSIKSQRFQVLLLLNLLSIFDLRMPKRSMIGIDFICSNVFSSVRNANPLVTPFSLSFVFNPLFRLLFTFTLVCISSYEITGSSQQTFFSLVISRINPILKGTTGWWMKSKTNGTSLWNVTISREFDLIFSFYLTLGDRTGFAFYSPN